MSDYYIGLISGTSCDGIDAVLAEFNPSPHLHASYFLPYTPPLRGRLLEFAGGQYKGDPVDEFGQLDTELGELFASAALALIDQASVPAAKIRAIGSHGQTVRHRPDGANPFTLQIADPNIIAARCGLVTVADFRRRDLALGGQGAPLVPAFHQAMFADQRENRAVINIGGIANITVLPAPNAEVTGFDTGPGNILMDLWSLEHLQMPFDSDGTFAASGSFDKVLLNTLLADEYFKRPPPKSTGREHFNKTWLSNGLANRKLAPADVMATLCELTARSISDAVRCHTQSAKRVILCGGGAHNMYLRELLTVNLTDCEITSSEDFGIPPDWVEGMAFAWLARETLAGRPGNLPSVTGARSPAILGAIYPA